jgi:hypothetical protein
VSVVRRARPSALAGRLLGAALTGAEEAIFGPKEERPGVYQDANGDPPGDQPFELLLDPDHPERSMVIVHAQVPSPENSGAKRSAGDDFATQKSGGSEAELG